MYNGKILNKDKMFKLKTNAKFPDVVLANLQSKESTPTKEKQIITADVPFDGLKSVTIEAIPEEYIIPSGTKEIVENGTYDITENANVNVNVPKPEVASKKIISNGIYRAEDENLYGYNQVEVSVPNPKVISKNITSNGIYNADEDEAYGYNQVTVNVPQPELSTKTITENGTYKAVDEGIYGYSEIEVNVPSTGVVSPEYVSFRGFKGNTLDISWLRTNNMTSFTDMFHSCNYLNVIDLSNFNTLNVTKMNSMFIDCIRLHTLVGIESLNTENVTDMSYMFSGCWVLRPDNFEKIKNFNTSNVILMNNMFSGCLAATNLDLSNYNMNKVTNSSNMFYDARNLVNLSLPDTPEVTNMSSMFYSCRALIDLQELNCQKVINVSNMFNSASKLANLGGLKNLGQAYLTTAAANYNNYTLNLSSCSQLTHDSLMNVINNLYDIAAKGCNTQKLVLGSTNIAKLTAEEIAIATDKGFSVS